MEDSMINMPDLVIDEKIGNKRVRDGEDQEIHKGRLEKRPSGILGVNGGGDYIVDGGDEGGETGGINGGSGSGDGIIDTFISNVFQKNRCGDEDEVKTGVVDVVEDEDNREDHLAVDGEHGGDGDGGGGGIIGTFFSNIFHHNGNAGEDRDQAKSDDLLHEVAEKTEGLGGAPGGDGEGGGGNGGAELVDVTAGKLTENKDEVVDLPGKDTTGHTLNLKPDEYSERVFFLNNN